MVSECSSSSAIINSCCCVLPPSSHSAAIEPPCRLHSHAVNLLAIVCCCRPSTLLPSSLLTAFCTHASSSPSALTHLFAHTSALIHRCSHTLFVSRSHHPSHSFRLTQSSPISSLWLMHCHSLSMSPFTYSRPCPLFHLCIPSSSFAVLSHSPPSFSSWSSFLV